MGNRGKKQGEVKQEGVTKNPECWCHVLHVALDQHKGQEGFSFSVLWGVAFQDTISECVNAVHFCIPEYLRHLNPKHLKIGLSMDCVTDVFVFAAMEQAQCEQYGAGANWFGGLFNSLLKCRGLYHLAEYFRIILSVIYLEI